MIQTNKCVLFKDGMFTSSDRDKTKPGMVGSTERYMLVGAMMAWYTIILSMIVLKKDRTKNGNAFNKQMLLTLMEKATLKQMATKQKQEKERVIPRNDMQQMSMMNMDVPNDSCGTQVWDEPSDDVLSTCKSRLSI